MKLGVCAPFGEVVEAYCIRPHCGCRRMLPFIQREAVRTGYRLMTQDGWLQRNG